MKNEITITDLMFIKFCCSVDTEELKKLSERIEKHLNDDDTERCADYSEECQPNGWMPFPKPYKESNTDD